MTTLITDRESKEAHHNTFTVRTRDQAAQTTIPYEDFRAEHAERTVQALAVSVHYLAFEVYVCYMYSDHILSKRK